MTSVYRTVYDLLKDGFAPRNKQTLERIQSMSVYMPMARQGLVLTQGQSVYNLHKLSKGQIEGIAQYKPKKPLSNAEILMKVAKQKSKYAVKRGLDISAMDFFAGVIYGDYEY